MERLLLLVLMETKTLDEDDDVNTFQSDSKDGKTKLAIDSKDGDITVK